MAAHLSLEGGQLQASDIRTVVLAEARSWMATPYRHQASCKGSGCDCLGLLRGIWRALYGQEPERVPSYSPDWAEVGGQETLIEAGGRWLTEIGLDEAQPGDVLVFRWRDMAPAKHVGILSTPLTDQPKLIHAYERAGVIESPLVPSWRRRIAAVFSFPEANI